LTGGPPPGAVQELLTADTADELQGLIPCQRCDSEDRILKEFRHHTPRAEHDAGAELGIAQEPEDQLHPTRMLLLEEDPSPSFHLFHKIFEYEAHGILIVDSHPDEAELCFMDSSGEDALHDDRITQGGGRLPGMGRIHDDLLRDGGNAVCLEDLLGEMFIKGARLRVEERLERCGDRRVPSFGALGPGREAPAKDRSQAFHCAGDVCKDGDSVGKRLFLESVDIVPSADDPGDDRFSSGTDAGGQFLHIEPAARIADKYVEKDGIHLRIAQKGLKGEAVYIDIGADLSLSIAGHRSMGLVTGIHFGKSLSKASRVDADSSAMVNPYSATKSVATMPAPPLNVRTATRPDPLEGRLVRASDRQRSIICLKSRASRTPVCARAPAMIR